MTLVIAKKIGNFFFLISDTSAFGIGQDRANQNEFIPKIIPYPSCVVSFAGLIEPTHTQLAFNDLEFPDSSDVLDGCLKLSRRYPEQLEFVHFDYQTLAMTQISAGCRETKDQIWLGEQRAFNEFQRIRLRNAFSGTPVENAKVWIVRQPEATSESFLSEYNVSLKAFNSILRRTDLGIGGFPVPFTFSPIGSTFGFYVDIYSGWDTLTAVRLNEWQTVNLNFTKPEKGSFARSFTGSKSGFRMTIPQIQREIEWHSPFIERHPPPVSPFVNQET